MIEDDDRDWPTSLMEAWLEQKVEGHATIVAASKVSQRRRLEAGGVTGR
jgi:hypothetical protein